MSKTTGIRFGAIAFLVAGIAIGYIAAKGGFIDAGSAHGENAKAVGYSDENKSGKPAPTQLAQVDRGVAVRATARAAVARPAAAQADDKSKFGLRAKPGERSGYSADGEYQYAVEPWTDPDDPAVIKLDANDYEFNTWRERAEQDREPGLINLHRYKLTVSNHGIKTFLGRHVALTPADLKAAKVDVAIFGAAFNTGFNPGSVGDVWGPMFVRANMDFYPNFPNAKGSGLAE
jgi:hypothetical protein